MLFSSHELETVKRICSHVVILHWGKIVADDLIERLRTLMAAPSLEAIFFQACRRAGHRCHFSVNRGSDSTVRPP